MASFVLRLGQPCTAATARGDHIAVATAQHEVFLLHRTGSGGWQSGLQEGARLSERHEATVTALSFGGGGDDGADGWPLPLRLVTSSHDRNSFVFTRKQPEASSDGVSASQQQGGAPPPLRERQNEQPSGPGQQKREQQPGQQQPRGGQPQRDQQQQGQRDQQEQQQARSQGWQAELVITKLSKAGLCCAWAPSGLKFAIGASDRVVDVIYWDAQRELWAPRLVKKGHGSAVMALAWHPAGGGALLATAAADGRLRLLNAVVPDVDGQADLPALAGNRFGDCLLELPLPGRWGLASAFSPGGGCLAAASQAAPDGGSYLTLLAGIDPSDASSLDAASLQAAEQETAGAAGAAAGPAPRLQHLRLPGLPLKCLAFLSDTVLAGGGFDCQPQLFVQRDDGRWEYARSLTGVSPGNSAACDAGESAKPAAAAPSSSLASRIKMFEQQAAAAAGKGGGGGSRAGGAGPAKPAAAAAKGGQQGRPGDGGEGGKGTAASGPHQCCIITVSPLPPAPGGQLRFVTASLDGVLAEWTVDPASLP